MNRRLAEAVGQPHEAAANDCGPHGMALTNIRGNPATKSVENERSGGSAGDGWIDGGGKEKEDMSNHDDGDL